jgi:hypothetical protein
MAGGGPGPVKYTPRKKSKLETKRQPSKAEQHVAQRRKAKALKDAARKVNYKGGLNAASIRNDGTLSASEKKRMLAALERSKGHGDG